MKLEGERSVFAVQGVGFGGGGSPSPSMYDGDRGNETVGPVGRIAG